MLVNKGGRPTNEAKAKKEHESKVAAARDEVERIFLDAAPNAARLLAAAVEPAQTKTVKVGGEEKVIRTNPVPAHDSISAAVDILNWTVGKPGTSEAPDRQKDQIGDLILQLMSIRKADAAGEIEEDEEPYVEEEWEDD